MPSRQSASRAPDDSVDHALMGAPFLAFEAIMAWIVSVLATTKAAAESDEDHPLLLPEPLMAFSAIVGLATRALNRRTPPNGNDKSLAPCAEFADIVRDVLSIQADTASTRGAEDVSPDYGLPDDEASLAPWLAFAWLARGVVSRREDDVTATHPSGFVFPGLSIESDDFLVESVVRLFAFVLRILRFMATPFSPSRAPPAFINKVPSASNLNDSNEDIASLAGTRLFSGARWRSKAQVRLRNTL